MSEILIKTLKKFSDIEPSEGFKKRSLTQILAAPQNYKAPLFQNLLQTFQFSGALVLASLLIFIILGGLSILNLKIFSPAMLASLDAENLNDELQDLDLKLKLSEVAYYENSDEKIGVALSKTSQDKSEPIDSEIMENEVQSLNDLELNNETLENLLNELAL